MTKDELIDRLNGYEWKDFECKKAQKSVSKDAYSTVTAFANTEGGWLIFGVVEKGTSFEVVGVKEVDQVQNDFLSTLRSREKINREISVEAEQLNIDDKVVLAFYIPEASRYDKPVYLKGNPKESYIRRGAGDEKCTQSELERFLRDANQECYDGQLLQDIPVDRFYDQETVSWFQSELVRRDPAKRETKDLLNFLMRWNFVKEKSHSHYPTRAGVLLFGTPRYINQILSRPILEYKLVNSPFDDAFYHEGERWADRHLYEENLFETWRGLVARYMRMAERPFALEPSTLKRVEDPPDYIAFREATINLLVHQDYGDHRRTASIQFFTDVNRFWNPGDASASREELLKASYTEIRNPDIISAFRRIGLSEQAGSGITAIYKNWNDLDRVPPLIQNDKAGKSFLLTLNKKPLISEKMRHFQQELGVQLTKEQADVLALAIETPTIGLTDIRVIIRRPYSEVKKIVEYLVCQQLLNKTGDAIFGLADAIRQRYDKSVLPDDTTAPGPLGAQVGTKSGPSRDQVGTKLAPSRHQVDILTACTTEQAIPDLLTLVGRSDRTKFRRELLNPLLEEGLIEMTIPDKPKSSKQRYRITKKGQSVLVALTLGEK
ncbi:RNA-binding domain-containing protein [Desulfoluna sp.]|uniref:RNA-binding domain-containing protein n=1 Tax=Desulfoluna sp. TaxID=2045199 RepID=UPI002613BA42|nr:RNA-binding domain-containing protein [Desulfoluna sp.]